MKNTKQFAAKMATVFFMILVLCTVTAHRIEILLLTEVRTITVPIAEKLEDGSKVVKVPPACVFTSENGEFYVMLLQKREGTWGTEKYVKAQSVHIYNQDYCSCSLEETYLEDKRLAIYPSRKLSNDETVRCIEE